MRRTSRFLLPLLAASLLAACQATPVGVAGAPAAGKGRVAIVPTVAGAASRRLLAVVASYGEADINHMEVQLFHPSQPGNAKAAVDVDNAHLYDTIVFDNLEANVTYTVLATAYPTPGFGGTPISDYSQSQITLTVTDDDRLVMGNLVVKMKDKPFAGEARSTGLTITEGGFTTEASASVGKLRPLEVNRATTAQSLPGGSYASAVAIAADGTRYVTGKTTGQIYKDDGGPLVTLSGDAAGAGSSTNGPGNTATYNEPAAIAVGPGGFLYVGDKGAVRKVDPATGAATTIAGHPSELDDVYDVSGGAARFQRITGLAVRPDGTVIVADGPSNAIKRIAPNGDVTKIGSVSYPQGLAVDRKGDYVFGSGGSLKRMTPAGDVSAIASGFLEVHGVAMHPSGHFYVTDVGLVWQIAPDGGKTVLSGAQLEGLPDSADADVADFRYSDARGVALTTAGEVFVTDAPRQKLIRIWKAAG